MYTRRRSEPLELKGIRLEVEADKSSLINKLAGQGKAKVVKCRIATHRWRSRNAHGQGQKAVAFTRSKPSKYWEALYRSVPESQEPSKEHLAWNGRF